MDQACSRAAFLLLGAYAACAPVSPARHASSPKTWSQPKTLSQPKTAPGAPPLPQSPYECTPIPKSVSLIQVLSDAFDAVPYRTCAPQGAGAGSVNLKISPTGGIVAVSVEGPYSSAEKTCIATLFSRYVHLPEFCVFRNAGAEFKRTIRI